MNANRPGPRDPFESDLHPEDSWARLWRTQETPDAQPELEESDARTQATVAWMRGAWTGLEPARPADPGLDSGRALPSVPGHRGRRERTRSVLRWAALLALTFGAATFLRSRGTEVTDPIANPTETTEVAELDPSTQPTDGGSESSADIEIPSDPSIGLAEPSLPTDASASVPSARLNAAGNIEIEHGSVRLVLLGG